MNYLSIIDSLYEGHDELKALLLRHSRCVADKALEMAARHPGLGVDCGFVEEAAMLHDIGIIRCDAPGIYCHGTYPYICHGPLGADILRQAGFPRHALVCERHTGVGLTREEMEAQHLPLASRDMMPVSTEEQLICFADKFFSKSHPDKEKTVDEARHSLAWIGLEAIQRFDRWCHCFL